MIMIEVLVANGILSRPQRQRLAEQLVAEVLYDASAPAAVIAAARALTNVIVHEPDVWWSGGNQTHDRPAPRMVVRVTVPGAWRKESSAELIARISRVVVDQGGSGSAALPEPWIHILGIAEGSYGTHGRVVRSSELIEMMVQSVGPIAVGEISTEQRTQGAAVDPVCGMTVALTSASIVLEHAGATYAFCSVGCRTVFAERLRVAAVEPMPDDPDPTTRANVEREPESGA